MKKFFMRGSNDELKFGDIIELNLIKELKDGSVHHCHIECKFLPDIVPLLLEQGIIEVKEFKNDKKKEKASNNPNPSTDNETCATLQEALATIENLELRIENLEKAVIDLTHTVVKLQHKNARKSA